MAFNFLGLPIGKNFTIISKNKVLDKKTGSVHELAKIAPTQRLPTPVVQDVVVKKEVEVVVGVDGKTIDFSLASSEGTIAPVNGFLVEVYTSGSDGKLTRVYREDLVDVLNDDTLSDGFSSYLVLKVDK